MAAIRLKGHEKFHLREGWIAKGLYGVSANPRVFSGSDGTDQLELAPIWLNLLNIGCLQWV